MNGAIELPAPCAGATLPGVDVCGLDAQFVSFGAVMLPDGTGAAAWVFTCRKHVRAALAMLRESTPYPEEIEAMSLDAFMHAQQLGVFERHGVDAPVLRQTA